MKKISFIMLIILNTNLFCFSLNSIKFEKIIKKGDSGEKKYELINNTNKTKKYELKTDNDYVKVTPEKFILLKKSRKNFIIKVKGDERKGEHSYHIIINEKILNRDIKNKNIIYLNKIIRIKQKYYIK